MDVLEALATRKSIRGFLPDPVPREVLGEVLRIACRAPSAVNSQPWEFFVLAGEVIEAVKRAHIARIRAGVLPDPEHPLLGWPRDSVYRKRQVALARQLFELMGISIEDEEQKRQWMERGFRFFDAPSAIVIVIDRSVGERVPLLDIGAVMQSICLAALARGLGTCIEDQGVMYPQVLRDLAGIPDSKRIIIAIAVGHPDRGFPANFLETPREPLDAIATWRGFE